MLVARRPLFVYSNLPLRVTINHSAIRVRNLFAVVIARIEPPDRLGPATDVKSDLCALCLRRMCNRIRGHAAILRTSSYPPWQPLDNIWQILCRRATQLPVRLGA